MKKQVGGRPSQVLRDEQHVLFVEGGPSSIDVSVLEELVSIRVEPLGQSYFVKSVAEALSTYHPTYYFLIDRDPHHSDIFVDQCWAGFPDPATSNLLVWRRREIENYFLDPSYICHSDFLAERTGPAEIQREIVRLASARRFLDAANYVVIGLREDSKSNWIKKFTNPAEFPDAPTAVQRLKECEAFASRIAAVSSDLRSDNIEALFTFALERMTGGGDGDLVFGKGEWLEMVQGKAIFSQLTNSRFFIVTDRKDRQLQGREKSQEIVRNLLKKDLVVQPADFQMLKRLIDDRVS